MYLHKSLCVRANVYFSTTCGLNNAYKKREITKARTPILCLFSPRLFLCCNYALVAVRKERREKCI